MVDFPSEALAGYANTSLVCQVVWEGVTETFVAILLLVTVVVPLGADTPYVGIPGCGEIERVCPRDSGSSTFKVVFMVESAKRMTSPPTGSSSPA